MAKRALNRKNPAKKPDEFLSFSQRVLAYVGANKKKVYGIIVAVLAMAGIYTGTWAYMAYINAKASELWGAASAKLVTGTLNQEKIEEQLKEIEGTFKKMKQDFPLAKVNDLAYPSIGLLKFIQQDFDAAKENYELSSKNNTREKEFYHLSLYALSKAMEEKGELENALKVLEQVPNNGEGPSTGFVLYQKARLLKLLNKDQEAKAAYEELVNRWPSMPMTPYLESMF